MNETPASIAISGLSFSWKAGERICRNIDLRIPRGSSFGLLGPNGVGKSTFFKLILGLLPAPKGELQLLGAPLPSNKLKAFSRIGSLIEEPQFYPHLSGRDNLLVAAAYRQVPTKRIAEVLQQTGLEAAAHRRVGQYSTGMKQRLGIARALLARPELLLLDEPTNGLDPQGIAEIRALLRQLHREEGCTLLISSHILSEIEQLCSHAAILYDGRIAFEGAIADIRRETGGQIYRLQTNDPDKAFKVLSSLVSSLTMEEDEWLRFEVNDPSDLDSLVDRLRDTDISIQQLIRRENTLESAYLKILGA